MSVCKSNAFYDAYWVNGERKPESEPHFYGSHFWELYFEGRIYDMPSRKEWHPTTWYGHIGSFFWHLMGGGAQDIFDAEWTGKIQKVYYCAYCREQDEVITEDV
jgi:hypothetical protein